MIPISRPALGPEEKAAVAAVLDSGILAQGPRVLEFERAFADYIGVKHAIATSSGTTALYTALLAHGIGEGDEVITTPFTFLASVNAILFTGATPVLVDIDASFNINTDSIERSITSKTRAILPVHLFGQPCNLGALLDLTRRYGLTLIEDACQAHGAKFHGRQVGSFGTACFSFYATKNMTTGEGGMITTDDDSIAAQGRLLTNHGMRLRYQHERLGYNFRLTEMAAAIGIEQLKKLDGFNSRRTETADYYSERLATLAGLQLPKVLPDRSHVFHQYTLRVTSDFPLSRADFVAALQQHQIGAEIYYPRPVHQQSAVKDLPWARKSQPCAEQASAQVVSLPVHPLVSDAEREYIVETIRELALSR
jgi:perosamine synthetase